jgi:hypothetical protein
MLQEMMVLSQGVSPTKKVETEAMQTRALYSTIIGIAIIHQLPPVQAITFSTRKVWWLGNPLSLRTVVAQKFWGVIIAVLVTMPHVLQLDGYGREMTNQNAALSLLAGPTVRVSTMNHKPPSPSLWTIAHGNK